jgi:hypothetical protein
MPPTAKPKEHESSAKRQVYRARRAAAKNLRGAGYGVYTFADGPSSIIAVRYSGTRFIRIVTVDPTIEDIKALRGVDPTPGCILEVWRAFPRERGDFHFEIKKVPAKN